MIVLVHFSYEYAINVVYAMLIVRDTLWHYSKLKLQVD